MRHRRRRGKLGVKTNHRKALLRNLIRNLVIHRQIETTLAKAKAARSFAERLVEIAKGGDLSARRLLISKLGCPQTVRTLITHIAPRFKDRSGGYTRVLRLGSTRPGDGAQKALLEFSTLIEVPEKPKKVKKEPKLKEPKPKDEQRPVEKKTPAPKEVKEAKEEKKESEKKGGFLSALRRFLKGDDK